jgi:iron complex transport system ATP-binding protein
MQNEDKLIEIRNVTVWRGTTRVFDGLSLEIDQHERVAILGPNGSGKTTLLKLLNRELYPVAEPGSRVRILGRERGNVWELRKRIGVVSHDLQQRYTPSTTALQVVLSGFYSSIGVHGQLARRITESQRRSAQETLAELGLAEMAGRQLREMSTGQQRRCLLARALVHRPDTLILDEPTAGLDFSACFDYLARLRTLSESGTNLVIVTHHLNEIPTVVDRVILLHQGRVVADGSKAEVLTGARLSQVYATPIRVTEVDGYYLAYPAD